MGTIIARPEVPPIPKAAGEFIHSQHNGTNKDLKNVVTNSEGFSKVEAAEANQSQDAEAVPDQADRPGHDLKTVVTNSEGFSKVEAAEANQSQNTEAVTDQADRPGHDLKTVVNSEGSPKDEGDEPNQSQNTEAITSPDQADRPGHDLSEKGSQSHTAQGGAEAENMTGQDNESQKSILFKNTDLGSESTSDVTNCTQSDHSSICSSKNQDSDSDRLVDLETLRAKMASYKALYDAGKPLPPDTDDDFYPDYVNKNSEYKAQVVDWMVEYSVPEVYMKTLESTTYSTWLGEVSTALSAYMALYNLACLCSSSKILAERLLELGYLNCLITTLKDQQYLDNYKDKQLVKDVLGKIIGTVARILNHVPDHVSYKQQDFTQVLKKYISSDFKVFVLTILQKAASEEEYTALVNTELEEIRAKMESYKRLYDAGDSLPGGSDYDLCPGYIRHNTVYRTKVEAWMLEYKIPELFKRTLDEMTSAAIRSNNSVYTTCQTMLSILYNMTDFSKIIAGQLLDLGYIEYYVNILTDPQYTENQHESKSNKLLDAAISTPSNCIRQIPGHIIYKDLQLIKVMQPFLSSDNMEFRATAMMIYSSLIGEDESKQLDDAGCIPFMIKGIKNAIGDTIYRQFDVDSGSFNIHELLECVSRIAVNDDNKIKLVEAGLLPLLVNSLQKGDEQEKEISAKLTWTLCFDDKIREKVKIEPGLVNELDRLCNSSHGGIQKAAKGALWKISGEDKHQQQTQQPTYENKHIFISYQWDDQQMTKQLNQRLKADGYNTWIDVEQMGGSTLDAMAAAVENAALVLICASEKYKLSPNCRTEGEYTYQRGKPLIPLMMQRHYKPDGWLGMLMGVKLYVNFDGKHEFEKAYQMLMRELTPILKVNPDRDSTDGAAIVPQVASVSHSVFPASQPTLTQPASQPVTCIDPSVATWSRQQVMVWANKHNLTQRSAKFDCLLESMDGKHLVKFCEMEMKAPDFFFKLMKKQCKLDMMAFISLELALEDLHQ